MLALMECDGKCLRPCEVGREGNDEQGLDNENRVLVKFFGFYGLYVQDDFLLENFLKATSLKVSRK